MQQNHEAATATRPHPGALQGLAMLGGAVALTAGYIALAAALQLHEFYSGFLFLLCWAGFEKLQTPRLVHALAGALLGLALGFGLQTLLQRLGAQGGYLFGLLVLPVIYCQILGRLSWCVNFTTMTFLAVTTIPHLLMHSDYPQAALALLLGVAYFGGLLSALAWLGARRARIAQLAA